MPAKRELTMKQLRQILRLTHDGTSAREIARRLGSARSTIQDCLKRAKAAGLSWPLPTELTDSVLEKQLYACSSGSQGARRRPEADWKVLVKEMKRPGVHLLMLWEEYREIHPDGYSYSRFCDLYRAFEMRLSPVMRQDHVAGDKVFVDYSGKKLGIADRLTGEIHLAEIFVGVLGASNYTYAEATWTQTLPDWIGAHVRMLNVFRGSPRLIVPDNLKSGVNKASFYDPEINRTYGMMAGHYNMGVLPARPYKPKDKSKVEAGVRFAQSYILGRLRNQTFFSLAEANEAIAEIMAQMNGRIMRKIGQSRLELFEAVEKPALAQLPATDYEFAEWKLARVSLDYHIELAGFFYSVPHKLIREQVDTRLTARMVEIYHRGKQVAVHERRYNGRSHGTNPDHMPSSHRSYAEWTPERFSHWALSIGHESEGLIVAILARHRHPEHGFRTCLGVMNMFKKLEPARAERVASKAVAIGAFNCRSIASIIEHRLDATGADDGPESILTHPNLRGPQYFLQ